ncbi:MAG: MarR family winged helix-turn-helix transcriptional regulator [Rhodobacteraceae bacterium]|jgi:DNA-binding MarR family transcriptional regulator|nr:MarR family winged helix-turn-helix transcriptional regulator [Paracoccaceae bacterium]
MESISACISFQASAAAKVVARMSRAALAPHGVTPIQFAVLQAVWEVPDSTATEIGTTLMIDSATIVGVIDRLVALRLMTRVPDPADRRIYRLSLTPHCKEALPAMQSAMNGVNAVVDAALGPSAPGVRASLRDLASLQIVVKE